MWLHQWSIDGAVIIFCVQPHPTPNVEWFSIIMHVTFVNLSFLCVMTNIVAVPDIMLYQVQLLYNVIFGLILLNWRDPFSRAISIKKSRKH